MTEEISRIALEAVKRFDAVFDIERAIISLTVEARHDARHRLVRPMMSDLQDWLRSARARRSNHNPVAMDTGAESGNVARAAPEVGFDPSSKPWFPP